MIYILGIYKKVANAIYTTHILFTNLFFISFPSNMYELYCMYVWYKGTICRKFVYNNVNTHKNGYSFSINIYVV